MSQRHQSRRRRAYGRRQHEVRERRGRREPWPAEIEIDLEENVDTTDPMQSLGDFFGPRFRLIEGT